MELTYTCEKSEKETLELAMRPFRRYFRTMFAIAAVMFAVSVGHAVSELMVKGLDATSGARHGAFFLFMALAIALASWLRRRRFRRSVIDTYRKRKTNLSEYRLSDDRIYCAHGESNATMPWWGCRVRPGCHSKLPQVRQAKLGRTNSGRSYIVKKSTYD